MAVKDPWWTRSAWLLPLALAGLTVAAPSDPTGFSAPWAPGLGVNFAFHLDGLARLFLLLITGIGTMVFFYAPGYLHGDPGLARLMAQLTAFMLAMIGTVLADDMVLLFVFWEATSILSFLLIGFHHEQKVSRESALQALLITAGGGLALLAGVILIQSAAPGLKLSELARLGPALLANGRFHAGVALVLVGCMTKSAQFPFHFWLPAAMAAPTPVSAYLHSATMVKLGIYLMARFDVVMGTVLWWEVALISVGTLTAVWTSVLVLRERDLKRIFAWSTVSALGTMTLLIGLPSEWGALALATFIVAHALYKAPLFFVAGNVDHVTGTRMIDSLRGLRRTMPVTATAAMLAGASMAGLPSSFGFVAKEIVSTAKTLSETFWVVGSATLFVSAIGVAVAGVATLRIFFGRPNDALCNSAHEEGLRLELPPLLLATLGMVLGVAPYLAAPWIMTAATDVAPELRKAEIQLATEWLSHLGGLALVLALGVSLYAAWDRLHRVLEHLGPLERLSPESWYSHGLLTLKGTSSAVALGLQNGSLTNYLLVTAVATVAVVAPWLPMPGPALDTAGAAAVPVAVGCAVIIAGAILAVAGRDTLQQLLGAGTVGFGSAFVFLFRGAPDLAFTQLAVETVFVIVAAVAMRRYRALSSGDRLEPTRALAAAAFGILSGCLLLAVMRQPMNGQLAAYFTAQSVPAAHGRNIVNVIIVDFRALDTLGEITVVMLAALAAWPLLRRRPDQGGSS